MEETTTKEKILKKIRSALLHKTDNPYPNIDLESDVYQESEESPDIVFAEELLNVSGNFIYCESENEFAENLKELMTEHEWTNVFCAEEKLTALLDRSHVPFVSGKEDFLDMEVGLTSCEFLVARLGSVMVSSRQKSGIIYCESEK